MLGIVFSPNRSESFGEACYFLSHARANVRVQYGGKTWKHKIILTHVAFIMKIKIK